MVRSLGNDGDSTNSFGHRAFGRFQNLRQTQRVGAVKLNSKSTSDDKIATKQKAGVSAVMTLCMDSLKHTTLFPRRGNEASISRIGRRDRRGARCRQ